MEENYLKTLMILYLVLATISILTEVLWMLSGYSWMVSVGRVGGIISAVLLIMILWELFR